MLAAPLQDARRDLSEFKNDTQARTIDFFEAIAYDLPPGTANIATTIGNKFLEKHLSARLGALFKLRRSQAALVITEAGGDEGWVDTIEEFAGFTFAEPYVPASSALVTDKRSYEQAGDNDSEPKPKRMQTVSQVLANDGGLLDEKIPMGCYSVIKTPNYQTNTIKDRELHSVLDEVAAYAVARHKTLKIGKNLADIYAAQVKNELKLIPARGSVPGHLRDLGQMLLDKAKNRTYVCARPHSPSAIPDIDERSPARASNSILRPASQKKYSKPLQIALADVEDDDMETVAALNTNEKMILQLNDTEAKFKPLPDVHLPASSEVCRTEQDTRATGLQDPIALEQAGELDEAGELDCDDDGGVVVFGNSSKRVPLSNISNEQAPPSTIEESHLSAKEHAAKLRAELADAMRRAKEEEVAEKAAAKAASAQRVADEQTAEQEAKKSAEKEERTEASARSDKLFQQRTVRLILT